MAIRDSHNPVLGKSGLALLRLVISSYFIAISLDIISGVNPGMVFMTWFPEQEANFIGASLMAGCSLFIFFGAFLRISCLYLALLVLSSTIAENLLMGSVQNPEALWRDVVFVSALMLVYGSMSRQGIGRVSLVKSVRKIRKIRVNQTRVMPRRVLSSKGPQLATGAVAVADNIISLPLFQGRNGDDSKDDVSNIFADVDFTASRAAT